MSVSAGLFSLLTYSSPKVPKGQRAPPKRGEKAFEPIAVGPSAYQKFTLDRARQAMADALSSPREIQTYVVRYFIDSHV
jgi:hypothetical protein